MTEAEQPISTASEPDPLAIDKSSDSGVAETPEEGEQHENNNSEEGCVDDKCERKRRQSDAVQETLDNFEARKRRQSDAGVYNQKRVRLEEVEKGEDAGGKDEDAEKKIKANGEVERAEEGEISQDSLTEETSTKEEERHVEEVKVPEMKRGSDAREALKEHTDVESEVQIVIESIDEPDGGLDPMEDESDEMPPEEEISIPPTLEPENSIGEEDYNEVRVVSIEEVSVVVETSQSIDIPEEETTLPSQPDGIEPELPEDLLDPPTEDIEEEQRADGEDQSGTVPENGEDLKEPVAPQTETEKKPCGGQDEGLHVLAAAATENASEPSGEANEPVADI